MEILLLAEVCPPDCFREQRIRRGGPVRFRQMSLHPAFLEFRPTQRAQFVLAFFLLWIKVGRRSSFHFLRSGDTNSGAILKMSFNFLGIDPASAALWALYPPDGWGKVDVGLG